MRVTNVLLAGAAVLLLCSCKGHSSGASSDAGGNTIAGAAGNVATITVGPGPNTTPAINALYTTVTVCAPGSTTNCQKIDNIQVDTGTSGLRLQASVLSPALAAALPLTTDASNNTIVECAQFADGYAWGPVVTADMTISSETALSLPIQLIGSSAFPAAPAPCAGTGPALDTVEAMGANGTIGLSVFAQDCGSSCALTTAVGINPGFYYACASATDCTVTTVPVATLPPTTTAGPQQVANPVTYFATDNNGLIIELPTVAANGSAAISGALVFGVDTQTNNASNTGDSLLTVNATTGNVETTLLTSPVIAYQKGFFDTGSNGLYFSTTGVTGLTPITVCTTTLTQYYCPSSALSYEASVESSSATLVSIPFSVDNAQTLLAGGGTTLAFNDLAGPTTLAGRFTWGLPFFLGRNVYAVIEGKTTTLAVGPYLSF
jgi:hypothetical protein